MTFRGKGRWRCDDAGLRLPNLQDLGFPVLLHFWLVVSVLLVRFAGVALECSIFFACTTRRVPKERDLGPQKHSDYGIGGL